MKPSLKAVVTNISGLYPYSAFAETPQINSANYAERTNTFVK
jgi:hypothetical protein